MRKIIRYGVVFVAMLVAIVGAGSALAFDDGEEAPFLVGTVVSSAFGQAGIVLANLNGKSYVVGSGNRHMLGVSDAPYQRRRLHEHNDSPHQEYNGHLRPLQAEGSAYACSDNDLREDAGHHRIRLPHARS